MIFFVTQSVTEKSQRTTEVFLCGSLCGLCVSLCNYSPLNKKTKIFNLLLLYQKIQ